MNDENKRAGANNVSEPFNLRLPHKTREKLDAVAAMLPILSAHRIALAALDIGLDALAANPSKVLSIEVAPRGSAIRGARGTGPGDAVSRGAAGASPRGAIRGARGTGPGDGVSPSTVATVRADATLQVGESTERVPVDIVVPEAVELVDAAPEADDIEVPLDLVADAAQVPEAVELDDDHEKPRAKHARAVAAVRARIAALQAADPKMSNKKIGRLAGLSNAPVDKIMNGGNVRPGTLAAIAAILPPEHTGKAST